MAKEKMNTNVPISNDLPDITTELGSTGLKRFGGWVHEEWLQDLYGIKGVKVYTQMRDNDPVCGAILFAIEMLIRQVSWRVDAASESQADQEAADFLRSCLDDMSMTWAETMTEVLSMLPFGWSFHEIVYKRRLGPGEDATKRSKFTDGRIGWRKIPIRAQESFFQWVFDDGGGIRGLQQQPPPDYTLRTIPIEKALLFRHKILKNNPEGRSIFRNAYRPWYYKKHIEELEGIGIERDLAGLPVAEVPAEFLGMDATPQQKAVVDLIKRLVTQIKRDEMEGVVFPSSTGPDGKPTGYKLSLLSTGSRRQFDTSQIITRYDQRIAMTSMADFILLGHEKVGSFALSSSKTDLFSLALAAILDSIRDVFNNYAIPRLFNLNVFNGITAYPRLEHGDVESPDLLELGNFISTMAGSGALTLPDPDLENFLREAANLPALKEDLMQENTKPEVDNEKPDETNPDKSNEKEEADKEKQAQMAKFNKNLPKALYLLYKGFTAAGGKKKIYKSMHGSHCSCNVCKSTSRLL